MADGSSSKIDDLIKQARDLEALGKKGAGSAVSGDMKGGIKGSVVGDTLNNIKAFNRFMYAVRGTFALVKEGVVSTWNFLTKFPPVKAGVWLYKKASYKKDKQTGELKPRPFGRKAARLTTAFLATAMLPNIMGVPVGQPAREVLGGAVETVSDAARMALFMHKNQVMYLNDEHIMDATHNTWIVKGMDANGTDWNRDGVTLRAKQSLVNDAWNLVHHGNPVFLPDRVVSPVAPGNTTKYEVTYYGARWQIAYWLHNYPDVVDIKALPPDGTTAPVFNQKAAPPVQPAPVQAAPAPSSPPPPVQQQAPAPK